MDRAICFIRDKEEKEAWRWRVWLGDRTGILFTSYSSYSLLQKSGTPRASQREDILHIVAHALTFIAGLATAIKCKRDRRR